MLALFCFIFYNHYFVNFLILRTLAGESENRLVTNVVTLTQTYCHAVSWPNVKPALESLTSRCVDFLICMQHGRESGHPSSAVQFYGVSCPTPGKGRLTLQHHGTCCLLSLVTPAAELELSLLKRQSLDAGHSSIIHLLQSHSARVLACISAPLDLQSHLERTAVFLALARKDVT